MNTEIFGSVDNEAPILRELRRLHKLELAYIHRHGRRPEPAPKVAVGRPKKSLANSPKIVGRSMEPELMQPEIESTHQPGVLVLFAPVFILGR